MTPHYVYTKADVKVIYFNMFNYDVVVWACLSRTRLYCRKKTTLLSSAMYN